MTGVLCVLLAIGVCRLAFFYINISHLIYQTIFRRMSRKGKDNDERKCCEILIAFVKL